MTKAVLFLIESLGTTCGGPALEVANLSSTLAKSREVSVTILTRSLDGEEFPVHESVQIDRGLSSKFGLLWIHDLRHIRKAVSNADIVFVTGIWGPLDGLAFSLSKPARYFIRICGMLEPFILKRNRWKKWPAQKLYVNRNLRRAEGLIVNSEPERENVEALGLNANILEIPNGVPNPPPASGTKTGIRAKLGLPIDSRILLYLGRIHPKKGLDKFITAMAKAVSSKVNGSATFVAVAGDFFSEEYKEEIQRLLHECDLSDQFKFFGHVFGNDKEQLFLAADAFLLPTESEGLPNAVLEAMARSLPLLITHGCNIPEVTQYNAGYLMDFDVASMTDGLKWFHSNFQMLETIGKNARRLGDEKFSVNSCVEKYRVLISES